jgi:dolichol-phosphate mannosyltransferase
VQTDRVTVVIPTYNEVANLPLIAEAVTDLGYRLLIVDDGSPDGTGDLADRIAEASALVSVLHRPSKQGLGPAYAQAFGQLIESGRADCIVQMDADFSHDPIAIPSLVEAVDSGADLAIGSRYVPGGSMPDWPLARRLISRGGNVYAGLLLGLGVKDATAGFRCWRTSSLQRLAFATAEASGYGFQVEMAWMAQRAGMTIVEVPITFRDRTRGSSKMNGAIVAEAMKLVTQWGLGRLFRRGQSSAGASL